MSGAAISFRNVHKRYGTVDALVNFDLDIAAGEFMTFLGPSGSGKTTALNALAGFINASEGDIKIGDRSIVNLPPEQRNVGMVFQGYSLFPHMNVFDNVAFPLRLRKFSKAEIVKRVESALEMVRLTDLAGRMPKELSGGQRQRVAFARAVIFEPPVLLMDEPLGALDLKLRQTMQLEIKRYHTELGCTIVFVTHDQGEALALSDRVAVMTQGQIAQVDTPDRIYGFPNSRYVAEFIGRTNFLSLEAVDGGLLRIRELEQTLPVLDSWEGETLLSVRPEKIHRIPAVGAGMVTFDARVNDILFQGDLIHYSALLPTGHNLSFQEHRGPHTPILAQRESIRLGFQLSDALPVHDEVPRAHLANV